MEEFYKVLNKYENTMLQFTNLKNSHNELEQCYNQYISKTDNTIAIQNEEINKLNNVVK